MSIRRFLIVPLAATLLCFSANTLAASPSRKQSGTWPQRVLITNDNGIHDGKVWALARAFARHSDTWLVAAGQDRSGTSNQVSLGKDKQAITVRRVYQGKRLTAYALPGYPADCVIFGVLGLLKDDPPDLVVSGVNGGPNLGVRGWFGSGTIGAARMAAFLGIPAIAVSGLEDDDEKMVAKVTQWVVKLAGSSLARNLEPGQYLTVAVPRISADEIRGIRFAKRAPVTRRLYEFRRVRKLKADGERWEVWVAQATGRKPNVPAGSDRALYRQGYIVITPMRLGEVNAAELPVLRKRLDEWPKWPGNSR
ncbi:MAG: hypothetical protein L0I62_03295 [Gammaproteobacteria bacterium]|nr:hypothetical protein [Gammaproteobacteria bacterium]